MKHIKGAWLVTLIPMLAMAAVVRAEAPAAGPATAPATRPAADIAGLIRKLGDDDFHVRLDAARQLKEAGKAAEPALLEARKTDDPEVHARVEEILADLNRPPVDTSAVPQPMPPAANQPQSYSTRMSMTGNSKTVDVAEPGRTIHLEEKPGLLYLKVTGQIGGKPATREYTAKTPEQLKAEHPAAFELYQQHFAILNRRVGMVGVQGNNVVVNARIQVNGANGVIAIGPGPAAQPANIRELAKVNSLDARLLGEMRNQNIPDARQQEVRDLVAELRKSIPDPKKVDKEKEAAERDYQLAGEALRNKIDELKLGDFDGLLPPRAPAAKQ